MCKESTPKGLGLALTPKDFYAKVGMIFLFKEISTCLVANDQIFGVC